MLCKERCITCIRDFNKKKKSFQQKKRNFLFMVHFLNLNRNITQKY